jgi:membrane protein
MLRKSYALLMDTIKGFFADEALTRGASVAYFSIFSIAPLIVLAIAVAGAVFGDEAASGAVVSQLRGLLGDDGAQAVQAMIEKAQDEQSGTLAGLLSIGTLLFAASGTFGALQSALNAVWKTETPDSGGLSALVRAKLAAIGLVAATAFLLLVSLVASAGISAVGTWITGALPGGEVLLHAIELGVSFILLTALFAAIYKVLPDRRLTWHDVLIGAAATASLFMIGKLAIGLYLGHAAVGSAFGAAGSLVVVLVWVYYSSLIFLLGAEFTRAWANREGSRQAAPIPATGGTTAEGPDRTQISGRATSGGVLAVLAGTAVAVRVFRRFRA